MDENFANVLDFFATDVCSELYAVAVKNPEIMVNDWCAYAVLAMYREAHEIVTEIDVPSIEGCFSGRYDPPSLLTNVEWLRLKLWHDKYWHLAQLEQWDGEYAIRTYDTHLQLPHYLLSL